MSRGSFCAGMSGVMLPVPARPPMASPASLQDARLGEHARNLGLLLEAAHVAGDRELALIFQRAMFDVVKLRRARRFGMDTNNEGASLGG